MTVYLVRSRPKQEKKRSVKVMYRGLNNFPFDSYIIKYFTFSAFVDLFTSQCAFLHPSLRNFRKGTPALYFHTFAGTHSNYT